MIGDVRLKQPPDQGKIQQHLANERTYLAWMRTAIAIMGVGFVTTSLHFELTSYTNDRADALIRGIGYASLGFGVAALVTSTWAYLRKRKGINELTFQPAGWGLVFIAMGLTAIAFTFALYLYDAY